MTNDRTSAEFCRLCGGPLPCLTHREGLGLAQSPAESLREQMARIIDPDSWLLYDNANELTKMQKPVSGWRVDPSLAKADAILALQPAELAQEPLGWPSREVIAREIRRAMLDNPTDESFNKRAEERERIANYTADVILERFAASRTPAETVEPAAWHCPACEATVVVDDSATVEPDKAVIEQMRADLARYATANTNLRNDLVQRGMAHESELAQLRDQVESPAANLDEIEQIIRIEFHAQPVAARHAAERVHNFLKARASVRAKTLARQATTSGLPLSEGQAEECDGGLRTQPNSSTVLPERK